MLQPPREYLKFEEERTRRNFRVLRNARKSFTFNEPVDDELWVFIGLGTSSPNFGMANLLEINSKHKFSKLQTKKELVAF